MFITRFTSTVFFAKFLVSIAVNTLKNKEQITKLKKYGKIQPESG